MLAGDGRGNFSSPQPIQLPAGITALASGDYGKGDGTGTLLVGISSLSQSAALAIFRGSDQGLSYVGGVPLTGPVSNIVFGNVDEESDAIILAGGETFILHSSSLALEDTHLPVSAYSIAVGSFILDRNPGLQIALLAADGSVYIAAHSEFDPRAYTPEETKALLHTGKLRTEPNPLLPKRAAANGWTIIETIAGAAPFQA